MYKKKQQSLLKYLFMVQRVATWEELEGAHLWNDDELKLKLIFVCLFHAVTIIEQR